MPLSNYFGWCLTVWLFYQVFGLFVHFRPSTVRPRPYGSQLLPILVYFGVAVGYIVACLLGPDGEVADVTGHLWRTQDLHETTVIMVLFTMLFTSTLALFRWTARRGAVIGTTPIAQTATGDPMRRRRN